MVIVEMVVTRSKLRLRVLVVIQDWWAEWKRLVCHGECLGFCTVGVGVGIWAVGLFSMWIEI